MASNQAQMYQMSNGDQSNDKENVVLRALVGDPNRHKPLVQHTPPTMSTSAENIPASMYTLETRFRPIPEKVLPKPTEPKVYYIENANAEPTPLATKEEPERPLVVEAETQKIIEEERQPTPPPPPVFLEPKIIHEPILYSIVGAKTLPVHDPQPIPTNEEEPSPLFYTITGQSHRPTIDIPASTPNVSAPVIEQSPLLYTLIGAPRLQVQLEESVKQSTQIQKQSPPILYSVVGNPTSPEYIPQTKTIDSTPSTQPEKVHKIQPVPILYTVVGETHVPNNISKENSSPAPVKRPRNEMNRYTVLGTSTTYQLTTIPRKSSPQKQTHTAALYPLVGQPNSLAEYKTVATLKPILQKKTPPISMTNNRRISRSLDRQTAPQPVIETLAPIPPIQSKRQRRMKEPTIPKSETIFIPLSDQEREQRPKKSRTTLWNSSPEQTRLIHKPYYIPQYDPLRLPDYISPYAYHPAKAYRERTIHPPTLPFLANTQSERKPRPPFYEPYYQNERKYPSETRSPRSLERYPDKHKQTPRLWDYEDHSHSDGDDDDDEDTDGLDSSRKTQKRRRFRPRTPWVPVW